MEDERLLGTPLMVGSIDSMGMNGALWSRFYDFGTLILGSRDRAARALMEFNASITEDRSPNVCVSLAAAM